MSALTLHGATFVRSRLGDIGVLLRAALLLEETKSALAGTSSSARLTRGAIHGVGTCPTKVRELCTRRRRGISTSCAADAPSSPSDSDKSLTPAPRVPGFDRGSACPVTSSTAYRISSHRRESSRGPSACPFSMHRTKSAPIRRRPVRCRSPYSAHPHAAWTVFPFLHMSACPCTQSLT